MRKTAIPNFKATTGKTTTAINLSHALVLERQTNRILARNSWKKKPALGADCNVSFSNRIDEC